MNEAMKWEKIETLFGVLNTVVNEEDEETFEFRFDALKEIEKDFKVFLKENDIKFDDSDKVNIFDLFKELGIYEIYFNKYPNEMWLACDGQDDYSDRYMSDGVYVSKDGTTYCE